VREHLLLSLTAQKQDLTDPAVVRRFAERVADTERLDYLYVLTVADINGTSARLWNSWKDQLLAELYRATHLALSRGLEHPVHAVEHEAETRARALGELQALGFADAAVEGLWRDLPADTFLRFLPEQLSWISAVMLRGARSDCRWSRCGGARRAAHRRSWSIHPIATACSRRSPRCSTAASSAWSKARIMGTREGNALDVFQVLERDGQPIADEARATEIVARLKQALAPGELRIAPARRAATRAERQFAFPPQLEFSDIEGQNRSQLALIAADRPGLLAEVAAVLREHGGARARRAHSRHSARAPRMCSNCRTKAIARSTLTEAMRWRRRSPMRSARTRSNEPPPRTTARSSLSRKSRRPWARRTELAPEALSAMAGTAVQRALALLESGACRVAEPTEPADGA
jgi:[protein-PII] uridylyltransferase